MKWRREYCYCYSGMKQLWASIIIMDGVVAFIMKCPGGGAIGQRGC